MAKNAYSYSDNIVEIDGKEIPNRLVPTLCMWLAGVDPRLVMSDTGWQKHRAELKALGFDLELSRPPRQRISFGLVNGQFVRSGAAA